MTEQDAADDTAATEESTASEAQADGNVDADFEDAPEDVTADEVDLGEFDVDDDLVDRVAESDPEDVARELSALRTRVDSLESQVEQQDDDIEELEEKLKRKQAEFQNYKKRMDKRREQEQKRATEDLVTRLLDVRDNLERALGQDEDTDIRGGVESTLRQLDDVLDAENVEVIDPEPGGDVDPTQHQVLARVDSDQPDGAIADVHRPGYEMADKVLREAQVTVSESEE
ncbi:molecular chaperone GrpE [Haloarcula hispanica N601]|uniref:Protein GrpE n=2 Tax=Haloarcula hispanica TaxID=51589 RepID=V5TK03_HALHI|nr:MULTISPECIES: nucleotide exchange factor GrpE [Haloarcula]AEM56203.1 heat shock protein GrpE protein [Haloarcula hispanica ATCC 33960]AHB65015.1 molecular chaperone GrpE [Haloarcula hispanica N601]AJF26172.1 protein GrpE [Haloarcula sp. CBA1115]KAA9408016.1 nucleotide exchange factor GrpE [Haloarcula sp. CBA1131]KZX48973.1 molecular chaperone GrpE [Haloarcula sp. K1]